MLIVGQGIAGSTLAWQLAERGVDVKIVDRCQLGAATSTPASSVAAGLVTPITGKRLTLAPDFQEQSALAKAFYRRTEEATNTPVVHEQPALRLLNSQAECEVLKRRLADTQYARQVASADDYQLPAAIRPTEDAFWMPLAWRLHVDAFLQATQAYFARRGAWFQSDLELSSDLTREGASVRCEKLNLTARYAALCVGPSPIPTRFPKQALEPAKGQVLTVEAPDCVDWPVVHRRIWAAPMLDGSSRLQIGATHEHEFADAQPTEAGKRELLEGFRDLAGFEPQVLEHAAAIRPATSDRKPIVGLDQHTTRIGWLNGLGAKGVLWAPAYAERLAEQLCSALSCETA